MAKEYKWYCRVAQLTEFQKPGVQRVFKGPSAGHEVQPTRQKGQNNYPDKELYELSGFQFSATKVAQSMMGGQHMMGEEAGGYSFGMSFKGEDIGSELARCFSSNQDTQDRNCLAFTVLTYVKDDASTGALGQWAHYSTHGLIACEIGEPSVGNNISAVYGVCRRYSVFYVNGDKKNDCNDIKGKIDPAGFPNNLQEYVGNA